MVKLFLFLSIKINISLHKQRKYGNNLVELDKLAFFNREIFVLILTKNNSRIGKRQ